MGVEPLCQSVTTQRRQNTLSSDEQDLLLDVIALMATLKQTVGHVEVVLLAMLDQTTPPLPTLRTRGRHLHVVDPPPPD